MTAHPLSATASPGIIKFDDVRYSVGINNLAKFKSTGKLIVEKLGLYLISTSIFAHTTSSQYNIYLNGNVISQTRIGYIATDAHSAAVVLVLQLRSNDSLWVSSPGSYYIGGGLWSTLTVSKLK